MNPFALNSRHGPLLRGLNHPFRLLTSLMASCLVASTAFGASLQWDSNGSGGAGVTDGGGTWINGGGNWADGGVNTTWNNANNDTAIFGNGGLAGTVNVSGTVNAGGLRFNAIDLTGTNVAYQIAGGTIALTDGAFIRVANGTSNTGTGRININSVLSGNNINLEKIGTDTALLHLGGANTWTGTLTLMNAVSGSSGGYFLNVTQLGAINNLSTIDVQSGNTLVINYSQTTAMNVGLQLAGNGNSSRGAIRFDQNRTLSGPVTLMANAAVSANTASSPTGTLAGNIGESGGSRTLSININGTAGTIVLSGNNTFTGGVEVSSGFLRLGSAGALNATTPNLLSFANNTNAKTVTLNGFSPTISGLSTVNATDVVTVQNASATPASLTIRGTTTQTFRGLLVDGAGGGALTLVKEGSGTQILTGTTSTYTGGTVLNGGILRISADGSLGAAPAVLDADHLIFNGGTLQFAYTGSSATPSLNANRGITLNSGGGTLDTQTGTTYLTGPISGVGALTKTGTGRLVLAGPSTYEGETLVNQGTLDIRHAQALGSTAGRTRLISGTRLDLSGGITVTGEWLITPYLASIEGNNTWAGFVQAVEGSTLTFEAAAASQLLVSGAVNANDLTNSPHSVILTGSGTGEISGNISNALTVSKTGTGTWTLSGNNSFVNGITLTQGQLILGSAGAANANVPNAVTFSSNANSKILSLNGNSTTIGGLIAAVSTGVTTENGGAADATLTIRTATNRTYLGTLTDGSGGGKLALTKTGAGTQTLGAANTYTGNTTVNAGTLQLDFNATTAPANNILSSSSALVLGGGTLSLTGSATTANQQTLNGLTVAAGSSTISLTRNVTTPQDLVINLGAITAPNGGSVDFLLPTGTQSATNGILTSTANDASGILGGWATVNGSDWATVSSGNIVAYTGYTEVTNFSNGPGSQGPIPNNANANIKIVNGGADGRIALANATGTTDINTLVRTDTGTAEISIGATQTLRLGSAGGILLANGAGALTIGVTANTGVLTAGGAVSGTPGQLIFRDQISTQTTTVNTQINNNGAGGTVSVSKNGPGLLVLAATSSQYSGGTFLNGGTVRISGDGSLGAVPGSFQSDNLTFNGGTLQFVNNGTLNANRGLLLQSGGGAVDTQTFTLSYSGIISGPGSLTKIATGAVNASGTLTLMGANTYSGETLVNSGTLLLGNNQALGSTAAGTTVAASAILRLMNGVTVTGETLTLNGGGDNNGNLQVLSGTATWAGDIIIASDNARVGTVNSTGTLAVTGVIRNGAGSKISFVGSGGGVVVLSGANTYSGVTDIIRGTVRLGADNTLPSTTILTMLTNTVVVETLALDMNGNDQTISGLRHGTVSNVDNVNIFNNASGDPSVLTINQATDTSYNGRISNNVAIIKEGSGTLTLTNTYNVASPVATVSNYTGKTTIRGGTLALSGTGNITGTPWIQVDQGATFSISGRSSGGYVLGSQVLSGRGSVNGQLTVSGSSYLSPGDSTGTLANAGNGTGELTFNNLTLSGGAPTLRALFQLGGTLSNLSDPAAMGDVLYFASADSGGLYDSLQVNGTLGLNAGSTLKVELLPSYTPQLGDVFNLLDWVTSLDPNINGNGAFTVADLDLTSANALLGNGWYFETDQFIGHGIIYVAIPEPSRALLLLTGLLVVSMRRRRAVKMAVA